MKTENQKIIHALMSGDMDFAAVAADTISRQSATIKALTEALETSYSLLGVVAYANEPDAKKAVGVMLDLRDILAQAREEE